MNKVYISFSAEIAPHTTESLIATLAQLTGQGVQEVNLLLSTSGGSVMNGLNLYNVLRAMPVRLVTHNVGNVDSIGNAVFLAGERRYACPHSTFMFNGVGFDVEGASRFEEKLLRERLNGIIADQNLIGGIIEERSSLSAAQVRKLFREAVTKDATYAVGAGLVDEIRDVDIPPGAPVIGLEFQR